MLTHITKPGGKLFVISAAQSPFMSGNAAQGAYMKTSQNGMEKIKLALQKYFGKFHFAPTGKASIFAGINRKPDDAMDEKDRPVLPSVADPRTPTLDDADTTRLA